MKKTGKTLISAAIVLLLVLAVMTPAFAAAPTVSASASEVKPGDTVTFTITPNNFSLQGNVSVNGPVTFKDASGATANTSENFIYADLNQNGAPIVYNYTVNADAAPGDITFTISNVVAATAEGAESNEPNASATVTIPAAPAEPSAEPTVEPSAGTTKYTTITLPAGTIYYTMVNGAPGASHKLAKATQVQVIENLGNGYTKIMMGTTTYLIKTSASTSAASGTKLDKAPKTGDATTNVWMMSFVILAAAGAAGVVAYKKVTAK